MRLLRFSILLILSAAFLNINCSNNKYKQIKQTPVDNSETVQSSKPAEMSAQPKADTQKASSSEESAKTENSENKGNYKYPDDNGVGPIKNVDVGKIDPRLVAKGKKIFNMKCVACHKLDSRLVGPPLRDITKKNTPVFIMNYLLNTTEMQKKDPILKKLVDEYKVIMPDQQLTKNDARSVLEYFRSVANK